MSNTAKIEVPGTGDDGKAPVYNESTDDFDLVDIATAAELAAHTGDTSDAHDASAVSFSPTGTIAGTDVQTAVAEVATDAAAALAAHEADTTSVHGIADTSALATSSDVTSAVAAHAADTSSVHGITDTATLVVLAAAAGTGDDGKTPVFNETNGTFDLVDALTSPIPVADGGTGAATASGARTNLGLVIGTDVASQTSLDNHINDTSDAHDASAISFAPAGSIAATTVQAAIEEVAAEAGGGGASTLDGLTDVVITAAASGDILRHNGTDWVDTPGTTHFEAAGAVATHEADTTNVHGITDTSTLYRSGGTDVAVADGGTGASTAAAALANLGGSPSVQTINAQTGTTYTVVLTDVDKIVTQSNASAITTTLPQDSDVAFPVGTHIDFIQIGAGQVTFAAGTGATVNGTPGLKLRAQWSAASAVKRAANTWVVIGDLAA